jgi:hypothetical protein
MSFLLDNRCASVFALLRHSSALNTHAEVDVWLTTRGRCFLFSTFLFEVGYSRFGLDVQGQRVIALAKFASKAMPQLVADFGTPSTDDESFQAPSSPQSPVTPSFGPTLISFRSTSDRFRQKKGLPLVCYATGDLDPGTACVSRPRTPPANAASERRLHLRPPSLSGGAALARVVAMASLSSPLALPCSVSLCWLLCRLFRTLYYL